MPVCLLVYQALLGPWVFRADLGYDGRRAGSSGEDGPARASGLAFEDPCLENNRRRLLLQNLRDSLISFAASSMERADGLRRMEIGAEVRKGKSGRWLGDHDG